MKTKLASIISLLAIAITAQATITNVMNNVGYNGTTNTASVLVSGVILPSRAMIIQNSAFNANATNLSAAYCTYLQASLDGTNYITVATNTPTTTNAITTSYQPDISQVSAYYRVLIVSTNTVTNTVYFSY